MDHMTLKELQNHAAVMKRLYLETKAINTEMDTHSDALENAYEEYRAAVTAYNTAFRDVFDESPEPSEMVTKDGQERYEDYE